MHGTVGYHPLKTRNLKLHELAAPSPGGSFTTSHARRATLAARIGLFVFFLVTGYIAVKFDLGPSIIPNPSESAWGRNSLAVYA